MAEFYGVHQINGKVVVVRFILGAIGQDRGDFNGWNPETPKCREHENGKWQLHLPLEKGTTAIVSF
jgi:hypothetical protein